MGARTRRQSWCHDCLQRCRQHRGLR